MPTSYADCALRFIGWFQVSGNLDNTSGLFFPETAIDGSYVSGPGWQAFKVPGGDPGDIVAIYDLSMLTSLGGAVSNNAAVVGQVLWDLVNPCGLSYWVQNYSGRMCVNRSDIISQFPHPANPLIQPNPWNPNGQPYLIWKRVTSYY